MIGLSDYQLIRYTYSCTRHKRLANVGLNPIQKQCIIIVQKRRGRGM